MSGRGIRAGGFRGDVAGYMVGKKRERIDAAAMIRLRSPPA
jgi:hypothetical protein